MHADERRLNTITRGIIGAAFRVGNSLGCGFLEKVYENALALELRRAGLKCEQQYPIQVLYLGQVVGNFCADVLVEDSVIVELKVVAAFDEVHMAQGLNYLKAT